MLIELVGINHRTAPVDVREKAAVRASKLADSLAGLREYAAQGVVLSTCNRTEIYLAGESGCHDAGLRFLETHLGHNGCDMSRHIYSFRDSEAVEHLFRVAAGLESMIVGEHEILGQVKQALDAAVEAAMASAPLRHLFQAAIRTGRRVRQETGISKNALSVSSVAVDLAEQVVGDLAGCQMLVIGAGEAGGLVARAARDRGVKRILVSSRTERRALALASSLDGTSVKMAELAPALDACDIVVTCAYAPRWILDAAKIQEAVSRRPDRPMVIIDIAVPRNVEPSVAGMNNVFLHNIDDLVKIADANRRQRQGEVRKAEAIISDEVAGFNAWRHDYEVKPLVSNLMQKAEDIRQAQLSKTLKKLRPMTEEERYNLDMMTRSIVIKLLQDPIKYIKAHGNGNGDGARTISRVFQLEQEEEKCEKE
ncbi:MAG: glutamyl-tRNA reductase [Chloroflexi bacterium]|nr:glutamyl-tRNA reductase [Chloroflexota bacterium]